ncbi:hypothetical protein SOV_51240 [Sporomusa ovata DSM 2662]|uniref:Uncharacterized protein n=1 Tax=Sporomusa ovata TaxID=2378 RepID=A0A0U1L100_9FIRM|nr:hypothetical protein [Sporomusa ovata]EQB27497.1 hypothetical protein SOV_2c03930 [Sporomusa ovata DSM 2662]CQR73341.1 hypothetical protein SpAn4DRAFT_2573 [Sporomusa ovata]
MDISMISPDTIAFGPDILTLIQIELQVRKISYQQIATKVHTATGTVGSWFSRGAIPSDKLWSVISAVGGAKLWMQVLSRIPGNVINSPYLDGTDEHPKSIIEDAVDVAEALQLLAKEAQKVIRHRDNDYQFTKEEEEILKRFEDTVSDSVTINQMVLVRMEEYYRRPVNEISSRQMKRMKEKGYLRGNKKSPAATGLNENSLLPVYHAR